MYTYNAITYSITCKDNNLTISAGLDATLDHFIRTQGGSPPSLQTQAPNYYELPHYYQQTLPYYAVPPIPSLYG